jgi:drug/metabolite transporter (DMT)-like permease
MPWSLHAYFWPLAAVWGASFLFMRIAAPHFGALATAGVRVGLAAVTLLMVAKIMRQSLTTHGRMRALALVGVTNSAIPFALFAFAALHLPAGYSAILNAAVPLWTALFLALMGIQRFEWVIGLACLLAASGIALMVKLAPAAPTTSVLLAMGACVLATLFYGFSAAWAKQRLQGIPGFAVATYSQIFAALALAPFTLFTWPTIAPSLGAWGAVVGLAVLCSALAYVLYFALLSRSSATVAGSVTFVIPAFGIFWAWLFLNEPLTLSMVAGFALVLLATYLITRPRNPTKTTSA